MNSTLFSQEVYHTWLQANLLLRLCIDKVVHDHSVQPSLGVLSFFSVLVHFGWKPFLCIDVYEEAISLFHANLYYPLFLKVRSLFLGHVLDVPSKLSVSFLCNMLDLPNEG